MKKNVCVFSLFSLLCAGGLTLLTSCLKQTSTPTQQQARLSVLQASPDAPGMDLYFDGTKMNTSQVIHYASGGVLPQNAGNYSITFTNAETGDTIINHTDSIAAGGLYSLIVYDTGASRNFMFFADQFGQTQDNTDAFIRFLQLSPDSGYTDLYVGTTKKYAQRGFADNLQDPSRASFEPISQGSYSFTAVSTTTGDTLGKLENITLYGGSAYTLFLQGIAGRTDSLGPKLNIMVY